MSKLVIIGPSGSGKTSLMRKMKGKEFEEEHVPTHNAEIRPFHHIVGEKSFAFNVWDCGGRSKYSGLGSEYFDRTKFAIIVVDNVAAQFNIMKKMIASVQLLEQDALIAVLVNKFDLINGSKYPDPTSYIPIDEKVRMYMMSVKDGLNTHAAFDWFASAKEM